MSELVVAASNVADSATKIQAPLKSPRLRPHAKKKAAPQPDPAPGLAWHALPTSEVFRLLETDPSKGITDADAVHRQTAIFGKNVMTPPVKMGFLGRLFAQINNILIYIMIVACIISGVLQTWAEFSLIILVVVINVTIGIIQEGKAEAAAEALKALLSPQCTVLRDGARKTVDAAELVPGDVVFLQSGDRIPADVRLFEVSKLTVLEALLTGEGHPIAKHTDRAPETAPLGDRKCMGFSATLVMSGQALGVVVETGDFTEIGRINALVSGTESGRTNLTVQLEIFGRWISAITAVVVVATVLLSYFGRGELLGEAFMAAVAVAVAIIPQGLPAVVTIILAIATQHMARQHAIVKSLPAMETLGSITVICSDKTGTLTKNEMTAVCVRTGSGQYHVSGVGYAPTGTITTNDGQPLDADHLARLRSMLLVGVLCSDGDLREPAAVSVAVGPDASSGATASAPGPAVTVWTPVGDPTEVALVTLARKVGYSDIRSKRAAVPRIGTVPFESEHKFMVTAHAVKGAADGSGTAAPEAETEFPGLLVGQTALCVKGAPDRLIPRCRWQVSGDDPSDTVPMDEKFWQAEAASLSCKGLRVLALCRGVLPEGMSVSDLSPASVIDGTIPLTMLCLVAILDPPREEAVTSIVEAHAAGITVKMITGDHKDTALAIGRMLKIADDGHRAYTGPELDAMTDAELDKIVMTSNVYARASPENKIRIVKALQRLGQVSSMTGDGVNDAPALKAANIGVAMGITGTDVSKEAAKMILTDDNFATIVTAVREGRRVWDNLVKVLLYNTPISIAQGMTTFFAYVMALDNPPLTALTVLYVNMITSVAMGMAFAFEPKEKDIMTRPPTCTGLRDGLTLEERRGEAFTQLVFCEIAYVFNCRFVRSTSLTLDVFRGNSFLRFAVCLTVALQCLLIYTPGLNTFFHVTDIPAISWGRIIGLSSAVFVIVECEKQVLHILRPILKRVFDAIACRTPAALLMPVPAMPATAADGTIGASPPVTPIIDPAVGRELTQAELDSVVFFATSASSFGIPTLPGAHNGKPGEAAHRPKALSTADLFISASHLARSKSFRQGSPGPDSSPVLTLSAVAEELPSISEAPAPKPSVPILDAAVSAEPASMLPTQLALSTAGHINSTTPDEAATAPTSAAASGGLHLREVVMVPELNTAPSHEEQAASTK